MTYSLSVHPLSIPLFAMAGITFYVGLYHLHIYSRRKYNRQDLTFALACLAVGLYDFFGANFYSATAPREALFWQSAKDAALSVMAAFLLWFIVDYTGSSRKKISVAFTLFYAASAIVFLFGPRDWISPFGGKEIQKLSFAMGLDYYGVAPGPFIHLYRLVGVFFFAYVFLLGARYYRSGNPRKAKPLLAALVLLFIGLCNDAAVNSELYSFIHIVEYAYIGVVVVMAYSLSDEVMELALTKKTLQETQARMQAILDNAYTLISLKDGEGRYHLMNKRFVSLHKIPSEHPNGITDYDFLPKETADLFRQRDLHVLRAGQAMEFNDHIEQDDGLRSYLTVKFPLLNEAGHPYAICAISSDTTARKQAEADRSRLAMAIEQVEEMIVITDVEGTIQYVNHAFERVTGYRREAAVGQTPRILKSGRHGHSFYREMWSAIARGQVWTGHMINKTNDGAIYQVESTISPLRDETGRIINFVSVSRDVTREAEMEARLRQSQKLEAIGTLAGGIAHDFNNILAGILGFAELARMKVLKENEKSASLSNLDGVIQQAHRASDLTHQILTFSRKLDIERQPVRVSLIAKEALKLLRAVIPSTIDIIERLEAHSALVLADPTQIQQVIMNLCTNAYHAMEEHGGTMEVGLETILAGPEFVTGAPRLEEDREYLHLSIRDTGHGMSKQIQERIFEPFFTTKGKGKGTGLGLSTVHGIVTALDGDIILESEPGRGTLFHVYLPLYKEAAAGEVILETPLQKGAGEHVLLVDDEEILLLTCAELLEHLGYRVTAADGSAEALEKFLAGPDRYDVVITDQIMPKMTGTQMAEEMRRVRPELPVIVITGYSEQISDKTAREKGISAFVLKPFSAEDLGKVIYQVLRGEVADAGENRAAIPATEGKMPESVG